MNKLTILGVFFDGYKDLWIDFVRLFKKYWPDCPYELVITSNTENYDYFEGIKVINAGKNAEYSKKIQFALQEVESDYYLILLEDFFMSKKINNNDFNTLFNNIIDRQIKYYSMPMNEFSNNYKGKKIQGHKFERTISHKAKYTLSCQPAIWEKNFLMNCIGNENYNAWVFEGVFCKSKVAHSKDFLKDCIVNTNNPLAILHGALQGKIVPTTSQTLFENGYQLSTNREVIPKFIYKKYLRKIKIRGLLPYFMQNMLRKIINHKSVLDKYNIEIDAIIKERGI